MFKRFIFFLFVAFVFFSCNVFDASVKEKTLVVLLDYDVVDLDPIESNDDETSTVLCEIYECLFKYDEHLKPVFSLVDNMKVEDDTEYTFHIKKNIYFHNGEELKASDVKFSLQRAKNSRSVGYLFESIKEDSFEVIDDYTVKFSLSRPDATVLMSLCHTAASIVCEKSAIPKVDNKDKTILSFVPIGTGPFKFVSLKAGDIMLERFKDYYGSKPYFQFMQFKTDSRYRERVEELEEGNADIIASVDLFEIERCKKSSNIKLYNTQGFGTEYLGMNMKRKPLDDIRVRKAIAKAIDVELINRVVSNGLYENATAPCAPGIPYSIANKRKVEKRDVEKAKRLLFEAGYLEGLNLTFLISESFEQMEIASKIKEQLSRIGINIEMRVLAWGEFFDAIDKGEADIFLIEWIPDVPDPYSVLYGSFHSSVPYEDGNYVGCEDSILDELLDEGATTQDEWKRQLVYEKAQKRIMEIVPAVFIYVNSLNLAAIRNYEGIVMNPLGHPYLAYVKPMLIDEE